MSATSSLVPDGSKFSFSVGRMRILFMRHPEWWVWFFSLFVWALLIINLFTTSHEVGHSGSITYCMPMGTVQVGANSQHEIQNISSKILTTISNGMVPWIIMVVAMMFPLLNEPIRHVAFSVRRKDRDFAILSFLIGYIIAWSVVGILFLLLPLFLDVAIGNRTHFVNCLIKASGFLLAAALIWHPARPLRMTKCGQTMPIRIQGWHLLSTSLSYGLKMGFACLNMCWAPMAALMLAHHNIILMFAVTIIIIYERYFLPHTSKLSGYAWGLIALTLFAIEMWA
jgi:predicted metal-binding membrane protein